jgi:GNAT superfamily N-acetyltransferase
MATTSPVLAYHPLTPDRWADLEQLFGRHGAYGGCWCMWWRCTRREFEAQKGEGNRKALRSLVEAGQVPGVLAYRLADRKERPVGWCSVAPRETYPSLERSPVLKRLDDASVWSLVCLFVSRQERGQGIAEALVRAAAAYVRGQGGKVVEAYPTIPRQSELPPVSSCMGVPSLFARAGFVECGRPSARRLVMRCYLE